MCTVFCISRATRMRCLRSKQSVNQQRRRISVSRLIQKSVQVCPSIKYKKTPNNFRITRQNSFGTWAEKKEEQDDHPTAWRHFISEFSFLVFALEVYSNRRVPLVLPMLCSHVESPEQLWASVAQRLVLLPQAEGGNADGGERRRRWLGREVGI